MSAMRHFLEVDDLSLGECFATVAALGSAAVLRNRRGGNVVLLGAHRALPLERLHAGPAEASLQPASYSSSDPRPKYSWSFTSKNNW